jgi:hypothetical protein
MTDFLKDCYFNGFCKGRKNFVPTSRYAKKLRAMRHSAGFLKCTYWYHRDHKYIKESLLYMTADIHGMGLFGLILAPQPYNKLES